MRLAVVTAYRCLTVTAGLAICSGHALAQGEACADAPLLVLGETVAGDTLAASSDGAASCGLSTRSADVWYRLAVDEPCLVALSTCEGSDYDTVLSVHAGCPGNRSNEIACNDDACGTRSTVAFFAEAEETYFVRVAGFSGATGRFTLSAECVELPEVGGGDLVITDIQDLVQVARRGEVAALSLTSLVCNLGSLPIDWFGNPDPRHPFLVFNAYRLLDRRLEQIGQSWAKHGFAVSEDDFCALPCLAEGSGARLGVGCSDTYDSFVNALQDGFTPRAEIDPWSGDFEFAGSHLDGHLGDVHEEGDHLLRIRDSDLDPVLNPEASYFVELCVVSADDVNHLNNVGWKPFRVVGRNGNTWRFDVQGELATPGAIFAAWPEAVTATVPAEPQIDGRCHVGFRGWENEDGTWHYEYGVYNLDMARGIVAFRVPVAEDVAISAPGFHGVEGDEPGYNDDDWKFERAAGEAIWRTPANPVSEERNPIRWGTLYSFRFDATAPPAAATLTLEPFGEDEPEPISVPLPAPVNGVRFLRGDCNGDGDTVGNVTDPVAILLYLTGQNGRPPPCVEACDADGDGEVNITDAIFHLSYSFLLGAPLPEPFPECGTALIRIGCGESTAGCP